VLQHVGAKWITVPRPPIPSTIAWATGLSATSATNVWIMINNGSAVDHWNGSSWNRFTFGGADTARVFGVVAVGLHDAWVITYNFNTKTETSWFYTGTAFNDAPFPFNFTSCGVNGLSASSPSNVWGWDQDPVTFRWNAVHFDGKTWTLVPIPPKLLGPTVAKQCPEQILAESAKNVWGTVQELNGLTGPIVLVHWNGKAWHRAGGHPPAGDLAGPIAPDGHGGLWLYAFRHKKTFPFFAPFFVHYGGGVWKTYPAPTSPLGAVQISAIALIPGTRSLWGAGAIFDKSGFLGGVILKFGP
jgi:hypothetical protein